MVVGCVAVAPASSIFSFHFVRAHVVTAEEELNVVEVELVRSLELMQQ